MATELTTFLAVQRARQDMAKGKDGVKSAAAAADAFGVPYGEVLRYATAAYEACHAARQARDAAEQQRRNAELGFEVPGGGQIF